MHVIYYRSSFYIFFSKKKNRLLVLRLCLSKMSTFPKPVLPFCFSCSFVFHSSRHLACWWITLCFNSQRLFLLCPFFFSLFRSLNSAWGLAKKWNFLFSTSPSEIKKRKERRLMVSCSFHLLVVLIAQFPQSFPPFLSSFIARFCHNFPSLSFFFFHCHFFFYFSLLFNALKQVSLLCYAYSTPKHTWTWRNWGPPFCFCFRVFFSFPLTLFSVRLNGIFCVPILRLFSWCTFFSLFNQNDSSL